MKSCEKTTAHPSWPCAEGKKLGRCGSRGKTLVSRTMIMLVLACSAAPTIQAQVALVVERGASTYRQAAQSFKTALSDAVGLEQAELDESGRLPTVLIKRWRQNPPTLVVAIGTRAARAASERLPELPILYCLTLRPLENQLPGPNIGGMVLDVELARQFDNIRKLLPHIRRIGLVYDEVTNGSVVNRAQQHIGNSIRMVPRNARTPREAEREIQDLFSNVLGPGDAFWLLWDAVTANPANFRTLVELSLKNKVALIVPARPFVEAGALVSVGANYEEAGRQLAHMAQQILAGQVRPGNFQAVAPAELTITLNGRVARQLGLPIPRDFRADVLAPIAEGKSP